MDLRSGARAALAGLVRTRRWGQTILCVGLLSVAAVVYAVASPAPLQIRILGMKTGFLSTINQFTVNVKNTSGSSLRPRFAVQSVQGVSAFWSFEGPVHLASGQSATYQLLSPNSAADPSVSDGFSIVGYTDRPATVSTSHRFLRTLWRTMLRPQAMDRQVPVGTPFTIQVQVVDHFNNAVDRAGIQVYFTQRYYTGLGGNRGTAEINGGHVGHQAVALTNRDGLATFRVVGTQASLMPVVFSAHLRDQSAQYNYGPSETLDVRFSPR